MRGATFFFFPGKPGGSGDNVSTCEALVVEPLPVDRRHRSARHAPFRAQRPPTAQQHSPLFSHIHKCARVRVCVYACVCTASNFTFSRHYRATRAVCFLPNWRGATMRSFCLSFCLAVCIMPLASTRILVHPKFARRVNSSAFFSAYELLPCLLDSSRFAHLFFISRHSRPILTFGDAFASMMITVRGSFLRLKIYTLKRIVRIRAGKCWYRRHECK